MSAKTAVTTIAAALSLILPSMAAVHAGADATYPTHSIRMVVPFAAGGPTDIIARIVAQGASEILGQQVYVENMPGAGGNLGVETVQRAAPDGYTVLAVSTGFAINPALYARLKYDPLKDFAPISLVAASPNVIMVTPSVPAKTLKELIALIKANPGKYSYAQPATGSTPHLAGELLKQQYGLDLVMVPFNGAAPAVNSTLGGYTPIAVTALPPAIGNIKNGSVRGIALLAKARSAELPDLPTSGESGVPGLESETLTGLVAPAGTPPTIVDRWYRAVAAIVAKPATRKRLNQLGFDPVANTPAEFSARIKSELARWGKVIRNANIHLD
jgi:tripartite-type tricarboxylate transporter receptor subunit TctC